MPTRAEISRSLAEADYPGLGRYIWRPENGGLQWSAGLCEIYGRKVAPASEAEFMACLHPDDRVRVEGETEAFLTAGADSYSHNFRILRPNGEQRYILDRARIDRDAKGRVTAIHGLNIDVTDFPHLAHGSMDNESRNLPERSDAMLPAGHSSEARLALGKRAGGLAMADIDYVKGTVSLSGTAARLFGLGDRAMIVPREAVHAAFHPEDRAALMKKIEALIDARTGGNLKAEHRVQLPDGTVRWVRVQVQIEFAERGGKRRATQGIMAAVDLTELKKTEAKLRESEERLALAQEVAKIAVWDVNLLNGEAVWTDSLYEMLEVDRSQKGSPDLFFQHVHPDDREDVAQRYDTAIADNVLFDAEFRVIRGDGQLRHIVGLGRVVEESEGKPVRMIGVNFDVTDRKSAELRLAERETQLATFVTHAPTAISMFDRDMNYLAHSRRVISHYRLPEDTDLTGRNYYEVFPDTSDEWREVHKRALAGETLSAEEQPFPRADGQTDYLRWTMAPWERPDGQIGGAIISSEAITEQVETRLALAKSESRYRTLFERMDEGFCVLEMGVDEMERADYRILEANPAFFAITGLQDDLVGRWHREALPDLEDYWYEIYGAVADTGEPMRFQRYAAALDIWFDTFAFRIGTPDERRVAVLFKDISEQKRHQQHLDLLLKEVNHRAKNVLSLVTVIAKRTASGGVEGFMDRFSERIRALAANQDLLVRSEWQTIPLEDLARAQLAHFAEMLDYRIEVDGPELPIIPAAAEKIGMALHELATNAAKYGALSNETGRIRITWHYDEGSDREFVMKWSEEGGPKVVEPTRTGFGSLVSGSVLGTSLNGEATAEYPASGFRWTLRCPLEAVVSGMSDREADQLSAGDIREGILVVEDDVILSMSVTDSLKDAGLPVRRPARSVAAALAQIENSPP
ncbi:MAG: PAS domain-containing protein, partial [Sulfitobacter sp.]|nr:PAS domain-containing protein [Sulfitobacter sp.]